MTAPEHDKALLGSYVLGTLSADEMTAIDQHVASCESCQHELAELTALRDLMGEVPPEAFLDGPPEGGDLMLQRTLRQVRSEKASTGRQRGFLAAAAIVLVVALSIGGGVLLGQSTAQQPSASGPTTTVPSNAKQGVASNAALGAHMTATVIPAAGWVRIQVQVSGGITAGERCKLIVTSRSGQSIQFGGWQVSPTLAKTGVSLDGTALVAPNDVASVQVVTDAGQTLLDAPIPA